MSSAVSLNPGIFREYDIRGIVGRDLNPEVVRLLGRAFGVFIGRDGVAAGAAPGARPRVVIGRDNRDSSEGFAQALAAGLAESGCDVLDAGLVVTPILYYAQRLYHTDGAVMITGSHNPPEFNGFKMMRGTAAIYGGDIQQLRRVAEGLAAGAAETAAAGRGRIEAVDPVPDYRRMLREKIDLRAAAREAGPHGRWSERPVKVVVDCGNGTASLFAADVLRDWGCDVVPLYCESDPTYPNHHPDPVVAKNLVDLRRAVEEHGADVGLAYDGDGDRIGAVDERGRILWGDTLMALYWREILPKRPGAPAIIEVKCSQALVEEVERLGGRPTWWKTGHSLIKAKMKELGAVFTGEMSGHMFFADEYFGFDDALYASGRLLRLLVRGGRPLSVLVDEFPRYPSTPEVRVDCDDAAKFAVVEGVRAHFKDRCPCIEVDGVRVLFPDGWGLVRASNTQPALVVRCEARTPEGLERAKREMEAALAAAAAGAGAGAGDAGVGGDGAGGGAIGPVRWE